MTGSSSSPPLANLTLASALADVAGIGPARARTLARAGLHSVEDFLWRLPLRYEDRSRLLAIRDLQAGQAATIHVTVISTRLARTNRRGFTLLQCRVRDESGSLAVIFFNQPYLAESLLPGTQVALFGTPVQGRQLFLELHNPQVEFSALIDTESTQQSRIVSVYERIGSLGPGAHRALIYRIFAALGDVPENLPAEVLRAEKLLSRAEAFRSAHIAPDAGAVGTADSPGPAIVRLAFEELLIAQFGLAAQRRSFDRRAHAPVYSVDDSLRVRLRQLLPFRLTSAQRRVSQEIVTDLGRSRPMRRLLQGDVGSGKTIVAALAMAVVGGNGAQAALMAPTELLAEQHAANLLPLFERAGLRAALLTAEVKGNARRALLAEIAAGDVSIIIGTHALIQKSVIFARLGFVVIDEQHRFGVDQREQLGGKGDSTHVLVMTATPIPRSLALTVYGDLDLSVLDELPPGRRPVRTVIKTGANEDQAYGYIKEAVASGAQAYVVCPLVAESESHDIKAAENWAEQASEHYFKGFSVGLVHGRSASSDRRKVMAAFARGDVQILFGTTVLEVGVDVPNASIMLIEHAERFGLSQLHQLRGRIGRGDRRSTCILMVRDAASSVARSRLEAVRATTNGFAIAEADLKLRGPGELYGTRQWGMPSFRVANILRDFRLLERARAHAARMAADELWMQSEMANRLMAEFSTRYRMGLVG